MNTRRNYLVLIKREPRPATPMSEPITFLATIVGTEHDVDDTAEQIAEKLNAWYLCQNWEVNSIVAVGEWLP